MPVDVFGDGVEDNVGTKGKRVLEIRGHEGIVDNEESTMFMCVIGYGADIYDA
jgi:hypothetical protein